MCLLNVTFFCAVKEHREHLFSVTTSCTRTRCFFSLSFDGNSSLQASQGICFVFCSFGIFVKLDFSISLRSPTCFACLCIWKTCEVEKVLLQHSIFYCYQSERMWISPIIKNQTHSQAHTHQGNERESGQRKIFFAAIDLGNPHLIFRNSMSCTKKMAFNRMTKWRIPLPKRTNFRKSSKGGGGVISNPKIYFADFGPLNRAFSAWKWYKSVFSGMFFNQLPCWTVVLHASHGK